MKTRTANSGWTFDMWMAKVNETVSARLGCAADDLPDFCYRDAYDDGMTAAQAAGAAIRHAREG